MLNGKYQCHMEASKHTTYHFLAAQQEPYKKREKG